MRMPEETEKWIKECTDYLKGKMARDQEFERRLPGECEALPLRTETKIRLEDALKKAKALRDSLYPLVMQARDIPFLGMEKRINEAWRGATDAAVACTLALTDSIPEPGNRALQYQYHRSAVKLAASFFSEPSRKETLAIARKIIERSGLSDDYSERSEQEWWSSVRDDLYKTGK